MIREDYVSFEIAILLKEKGFDEPCNRVYMHDGKCVCAPHFMEGESFVDNDDIDAVKRYNDWIDYIQGEYAYLCPSISLAMKWLREVHNFNVNIELTIHGYFCSFSHIVRDSLGHIIDIEDSEAWETAYYDSYEEACEAAIKYCLENMIRV